MPHMPLRVLAAALSWTVAASFSAATVPAAPLRALRVPQSPRQMTDDAAAAVRRAAADGVRRQLVQIVVPEPPMALETDVDPWPGGLNQMYGELLPLAKEIIARSAGVGPAAVRETVVVPDDCCALLVCEAEAAADDCAALIFPGASAPSMEAIEKAEALLGPSRTLVLINPQFKRPEDFVFYERGKAKAFFERREPFQTTYAYEELACRSEDVKFVCEGPGRWGAWARPDMESGDLLALHDAPLADRPNYSWLERTINEKIPDPPWMRKMGEAMEEGPRFMR